MTEEDKVIHLEKLDDYERIIKEKPKVVIDFCAVWCQPCQQIAPYFKELSTKFPDVSFLNIDVDKSEDICKKENIVSMPTFIFYKNGESFKRIHGNDDESLIQTLAELSPDSPAALDYIDPENIKQVHHFDEYINFIKDNEVAIANFFSKHSYSSHKTAPLFRRLAREHPKIQFIKIDMDEEFEIARKLKCYKPKFFFFYKGENKLTYDEPSPDLLEERVNVFDPENKAYLDPSNSFTSKDHLHPLVKIRRSKIHCSKCFDDFEDEPADVYFCLECQFNLCECCKLREEGKEVPKKESLVQLITDEDIFNQVISQHQKVVVNCFTENCSVSKLMKEFAEEYKEIKFIRVKCSGTTEKLNAKFRKYIDQSRFACLQDGKVENKIELEGNYKINNDLFLFSGRKKDAEKFKSILHRHELVKMNHTHFKCDLCATSAKSEGFSPVFRCCKCDFDLCLDCFEKEKKGEITKENPRAAIFIPAENFSYAFTPEKYEKIIKENDFVILGFYENFFVLDTMLKFAKRFPKIKFVLVDSDDFFNRIREISFYYKGKSILTLTEPKSDILEEKIKEFDPENKAYLDPENKFISKDHPHPLVKIKRNQVYCSKCLDDFEGEPAEVYYCLECQYNLCECCKLKEEGKEAPKKETLVQLIRDEDSFNQIISQNSKVVAFFFKERFQFRKLMTVFAEEYKEMKFIRIKYSDSIQEIAKKFKFEIDEYECRPEFHCIKNGVLEKKVEIKGSYFISSQLFNFSGREKEAEKFKSILHKHRLIKMNHGNYQCQFCGSDFHPEGLTPALRCDKCEFDICLDCYEKEKKGEITKETPGAKKFLTPENFCYPYTYEEFDNIIGQNDYVIVGYYRKNMQISEMENFGKNYPKVNFIFVDVNEGIDKNFNDIPEIVFYYKGKRIFSLSEETYIWNNLLVNRLKEFDPENKAYSDPENKFISKDHPHPLVKIKRYEVHCSKCLDDFEFEPADVYYCLECQYNLCECCKLKEEGKEAPEKECFIQNIHDESTFNQVISKNSKVVAFFYESSLDIKTLRCFAKEFQKELKFIRIKHSDATNEVFKKYEIEHNTFLFFKNGQKEKELEKYGNYLNDELWKLSERVQEKMKFGHHEHEFIKMNYFLRSCECCKDKRTPYEFGAIYRCEECKENICNECYEKVMDAAKRLNLK